MWVLNGDMTKLYGNYEQWTAPDGTSYPGNWDKSSFPGFQEVVLTPQPAHDDAVTVTGNAVEMVNGIPTVVWQTAPVPPKSPEELAADAKSHILMQIATLEGSITARRWREAGPDDAGGTAEGRAWLKGVSDQIAALRGTL